MVSAPYTIILLLYFFQGPAGVGGAKFTLINNCSQIVWPAILGRTTLQTQGFELRPSNSVAVQVPSTGWTGSVWGRTGCSFNASGYGSCATGDCGQLECKTTASASTLVELTLGGIDSSDFYDVSLVNGFNLPLLLEPSGPAQCESTGCAADVNRICPSDLRTQGGRACRDPCEAFNNSAYCCTEGATRCGPTSYSRVFKEACPDAYSYPQDDATSTFTCSGGADYIITFCPASTSFASTSLALTENGVAPAQSPAPSLPPSTTNGKNHSKVIIIVVVLSVACVIIVSIILLCYLKRRHSASVPNKESKQHIEDFLLQYGSVAPKRYKYSEIKKITKSFSDELGKGGYGSVYKGVLPDSSLVAVKVLMETDSNGEEFMNEVASISKTSHVNIVTLLGFCFEGKKRALVYEFMPNKSLDKFLITDGSATLDLEKLYKIAIGIAKGLEYLHTGCNTRIVHFDIKPQNILLDEDFCPKIADFGLAKLCKKKQSVLSVIGARGTIGYIAPEVFSRTFGRVSHKSDVYSYGMMVLEMAGAKKIGEANTLQSSENYFPDKIYEYAILGTTSNLDDFTIEDAEETTRKMFLVGFWCIQTAPSDRPPMSKVVEMLEGSVQSIQIPPKPVLFTPILPHQIFSSSLSEHIETENSTEIIAIDNV